MEQNVTGKPLESPSRKDARVLVVGILNIVFSIVYLGCFALGFAVVPTVVETARQAVGDIAVLESIAGVATNGLIFLGLLSSGILLLRGSALGRSLTRLTALVAILFLVFDGCVTLSIMGRLSGYSEATLGIIFGLGGVLVRVAYPLVAAAVLSSSPQDLGLQ